MIKNSVSVVQMELWTARWPPSHTLSHTSSIVIHLLSSYWQCVGLSESDTSRMATAPWQPSASKQIHQLREKEREREAMLGNSILPWCFYHFYTIYYLYCAQYANFVYTPCNQMTFSAFAKICIQKSTLCRVSHNATCSTWPLISSMSKVPQEISTIFNPFLIWLFDQTTKR